MLLAAFGLVIFDAQPAFAAYSCQDNEVCFYENPGYTGSVFVPNDMRWGNSGSVSNFSWKTFANGMNANDRVTSIINNTGWCVTVFTYFDYFDDGGGRWGYNIPADSRVDFEGMGTGYNNRISSAKFRWPTTIEGTGGRGQATNCPAAPGGGEGRPGGWGWSQDWTSGTGGLKTALVIEHYDGSSFVAKSQNGTWSTNTWNLIRQVQLCTIEDWPTWTHWIACSPYYNVG